MFSLSLALALSLDPLVLFLFRCLYRALLALVSYHETRRYCLCGQLALSTALSMALMGPDQINFRGTAGGDDLSKCSFTRDTIRVAGCRSLLLNSL